MPLFSIQRNLCYLGVEFRGSTKQPDNEKASLRESFNWMDLHAQLLTLITGLHNSASFNLSWYFYRSINKDT